MQHSTNHTINLLARRIVLAVALTLCLLQTAGAQTLTANVEPAGSYYRLTFTVNSTDAKGFTPPSLADFEVLNGPATSTMSSMQVVNGRMSHTESTSYTYILAARKSGHITIGPATVKVGGRVLRSAPVSVNARGGASSQHGSAAASSGGTSAQQLQQTGSPVTQRDLFIDVTPSRTQVYEQEAVLLTYRIHTRLGVGLAGTELVGKPDFKGFLSQEIPLPGNQIQSIIEHRANGTYRTGTLLQYVVFPQQSGKITVPGVTFNCTVAQQDNTLDPIDAFFNGGSAIGVKVKRVVPSLVIDVKALPQPKPAGFSGAVGKMQLKGELLNPKLRTNDVATYRVTLSGTGNLKLVSAPTVTFPKDFDHYEAKTTDNTRVTPDGLTGTVTFDYTFVPRNVGQYEIPALAFTYFDTTTGEYRTLHTETLKLDVAQGERSNDDVDRQLQLMRSDIRNVHPVEALNATPTLSFESDTTAATVFALLLLATIVAIVAGRRHMKAAGDTAGQRRKKAAKRCLGSLKEAQQHAAAADTREWHAQVARTLYTFIADRYGLPTADMTKDSIRNTLSSHNVPSDTADLLLGALETCEQAQYAPTTADMREAVIGNAMKAVNNIAS